MTVREDEERGLDTQGTLPPAATGSSPGELTATPARFPRKTRRVAAVAMLVVFAVQLVWIVALIYWIARVLW